MQWKFVKPNQISPDSPQYNDFHPKQNENNMTTQTFHRDRFTWLAYLLLAFYGYFLNILRIGRRRSLWIAAFGISFGALVLLAGRVAPLTIGASFCMGLIGSLILIIIPSALSDHHGELRAVALSEANVIASLIATAAPLMVGWCANLPGGWRLALGIAALAPLLMWFGFGSTSLPKPVTSTKDSESTKTSLPVLFWVYWLAIVLAVSVEFCMISWSADYLEKSLSMPRVSAAQSVSLFLAAMIFGRMAVSRLVHRFAAHRVVIASVVVAGIGFALFWLTNVAILGQVGLFLTGLGVAGQYPLLLSLAIGVAKNNSTQATARTTLASGTAILALPLVLGRLADMMGIRQAYGVVGILLVGVFLITLAARKKT